MAHSGLEIKTRHAYRSAFYGLVLALISMMPYVWNVMDFSKISVSFCGTLKNELANCKLNVISDIPVEFRFFSAFSEWCLGIFAISVSAVLNWLESMFDCDLSGPPSYFTAFSFIGGLSFMIFYFVIERNNNYYKINYIFLYIDFISYLVFGACVIIASVLSIASIRRSKDRIEFDSRR